MTERTRRFMVGAFLIILSLAVGVIILGKYLP